MLRFGKSERSEWMNPAFCSDQSFTPDDLQILWGFKPFVSQAEADFKSAKNQKADKGARDKTATKTEGAAKGEGAAEDKGGGKKKNGATADEARAKALQKRRESVSSKKAL